VYVVLRRIFTVMQKSAITGHVAKENHVIN